MTPLRSAHAGRATPDRVSVTGNVRTGAGRASPPSAPVVRQQGRQAVQDALDTELETGVEVRLGEVPGQLDQVGEDADGQGAESVPDLGDDLQAAGAAEGGDLRSFGDPGPRRRRRGGSRDGPRHAGRASAS